MNDENVRVAWNAAYWLLRSEARRQAASKFPDCDWKMVEANDECVATMIEAQAKVCMRAMDSGESVREDTDGRCVVRPFVVARSRLR